MTNLKKTISLILVVFMCLGVVPMFASAEGEVKSVSTSDYAFNENEIVFTFAALSDPHIGYGSNDQVLRNTLSTIKKYAKNGIDAVLFAGDQTQDGTKPQAELFASIVKEAFDVTKVPIIFAHGNHDVYWSGCMTRAEFVNAYGQDMYLFDQDMTSASKGNRHVEINGYHFLTVDIETFMPNYNTLSTDTENWLKNTLDRIIGQDPNSYVFVSCHSPAKDTAYGSMSDDIKGTGDWGASKELDDILKEYPQVILLSGHTHYGINLETNINQSTYTQINLGSSSDIEFDVIVPENRRSFSQGMIVDIDKDNNIRITRIDIAKDMVIKNPWYIDAYKVDGSSLTRYSKETRLANNRAPQFPSGIDVVEVSSTELRVDFKAAVDDDMVFFYQIEVLNESGATIASNVIVTPFYNDPQLQNMPKSYSTTFTGNFKYPYTVKVRAYDCYYQYTEVSQIFVDMTEENSIIAARFDTRIDELLAKDLTESDIEFITTMRKEINKLNYKVKNIMNKLDDFEELERQYYNKYYITSCSNEFAPYKSNMYSIAPMTSKGWIEDSKNIGATLNWSEATKNYFLGFNSKVNLDGLHIGLTNLNIKSENKVLGIFFSNTYKDKWLSNEGLLVNIDFASGNVSTGSGVTVGRSDYLVYGNTGAIPFDLKFEMTDVGNLNMTIISPLGTDVLTVPANCLNALTNLTDISSCYVSFSPWATKSTMSVDITAIHSEEKASVDNGDNPGQNGDDGRQDLENMSLWELIVELFKMIFKPFIEFFKELFKA